MSGSSSNLSLTPWRFLSPRKSHHRPWAVSSVESLLIRNESNRDKKLLDLNQIIIRKYTVIEAYFCIFSKPACPSSVSHRFVFLSFQLKFQFCWRHSCARNFCCPSCCRVRTASALMTSLLYCLMIIYCDTMLLSETICCCVSFETI